MAWKFCNQLTSLVRSICLNTLSNNSLQGSELLVGPRASRECFVSNSARDNMAGRTQNPGPRPRVLQPSRRLGTWHRNTTFSCVDCECNTRCSLAKDTGANVDFRLMGCPPHLATKF